MRPSSERFEVGALLGRGGMGDVRLARDVRVDRDVALKSLRGATRPEAVARFLREAKVQARLDHPAIVPVYDVGLDDNGVPYFAMKRVTGVTLDHAIQNQWPRRQLLARLVDVCLAIELAHTRGVVHRDLKPSNIMLGDFGEVYVLDWGIAAIADTQDEPATSDADPTTDTATGAVLGTLGYMAPEQIEAGVVSPRTDVFALGLLLYEILAGKPALPRGGDAYEPTLASEFHHPGDDVPPELADACVKATANRPLDRFPSARALADAITRYLDGDRDLERRRSLAVERTQIATQALADGACATAMREAGRALALDPTDPHALELIRQILGDAPRETPADVVAKREAERRAATHMQLGISQKIYSCFLALLPLALFTRINSVSGTGILMVMLVVAIVGAGYVRRHLHLIDRWMSIVLVMHIVMMAILGTMVGPFQLVPIVGVISLAMFLNHPATKRYGVIVVAHMVMVVLPLFLELLSITPSTFTFEGATLRITLAGSDLHPAVITGAIVGTVWLLQLVISLLMIRQRRAQEAARDQLHLRTWRLGQLLPPTLPPER